MGKSRGTGGCVLATRRLAVPDPTAPPKVAAAQRATTVLYLPLDQNVHSLLLSKCPVFAYFPPQTPGRKEREAEADESTFVIKRRLSHRVSGLSALLEPSSLSSQTTAGGSVHPGEVM